MNATVIAAWVGCICGTLSLGFTIHDIVKTVRRWRREDAETRAEKNAREFHYSLPMHIPLTDPNPASSKLPDGFTLALVRKHYYSHGLQDCEGMFVLFRRPLPEDRAA